MNYSRRQSVLKSTLLIFTGRTISRVLGIIREILSASFFGTGIGMDCYNLAYTTVIALRQLFTEQFLTPIVPTFFQRQKEDGEEATLASIRAINTRLNFVSLLICIVLFLAAEPIVRFLAPGFTEEKLLLSAKITRWFAIGGFGIILHRYYCGLYTCYFRYFVVAYSPLIMNLVSITVLILFAKTCGIISLASGFSLGFLAFIFTLFWFLPQRQQLLKPRWGRRDSGVAFYNRMLFPLFLSVGAEQVQLIVDRSLASRLPEGTLSTQGYALRLVRLNAEFFISTFVIVIAPILASLAARAKTEEFARNFSLSLQAAALYVALGGSIIVTLALPIVRVVFERGAFTPEASVLTAELIIYYTVAYAAQALVAVVFVGYNAFGDTRTPTITTIIAVSVMVALDYLLIGPMGIQGLALATAIGYCLNLLLAYILFVRRLSRSWIFENIKVVFLSLLLAVILGYLMNCGWKLAESKEVLNGLIAQLIGIGFFAATAALIYIFILKLLKVRALEFLITKLKTRRTKIGDREDVNN